MSSANPQTDVILAYVALGSNLGDSRQIIRAAITRLRDFAGGRCLISSLWQTSPVDCPPGSPVFLNAVVGFPVGGDLTPETLLTQLQMMEKDFGRRAKKILNEPRPLDLDLIAFGRETRQLQNLILPHPRAHQRKFVLYPLSEIAADLILPGQEKTVSQLLAGLPDHERIERLD